MLTEKVWCKTLKPNYTYPLKTISNYRLNRNFTIFLFHNIVTIMIIMTQVCLEEMAPPKRIFQCKNGHHLCETCKWVQMSFLKYEKFCAIAAPLSFSSPGPAWEWASAPNADSRWLGGPLTWRHSWGAIRINWSSLPRSASMLKDEQEKHLYLIFCQEPPVKARTYHHATYFWSFKNSDI